MTCNYESLMIANLACYNDPPPYPPTSAGVGVSMVTVDGWALGAIHALQLGITRVGNHAPELRFTHRQKLEEGI